MISSFIKRYQRAKTPLECLAIGAKALIAIMVLAFMNDIFGVPFLMAPFGASAILVFTTPKDEFAQPINILGGYLISGIISLGLFDLLPHQFWVEALALGVCVTVMAMLRLTHPPAGAVPVVIYFGVGTIDYWFLISPIFCGSATLVLLALILHKVPPKAEYPRKE